MLLCSITMTVGTSIGGYKIIKTVGMKMVKLEPYQGTSADLAGATVLFISSLFGMPVSTTQVKTSSIMGVGASKRISSVNWNIVKNMIQNFDDKFLINLNDDKNITNKNNFKKNEELQKIEEESSSFDIDINDIGYNESKIELNKTNSSKSNKNGHFGDIIIVRAMIGI